MLQGKLFLGSCFLCVSIHNWACAAEALNTQRLPGHIRKMVSAQTLHGSGLMGKGWRAYELHGGQQGSEAGRGRTRFILNRNAFQCVSGELELPSCSQHAEQTADALQTRTTPQLSGTNTNAGGAAIHRCGYHVISVTISLSTWLVKTVSSPTKCTVWKQTHTYPKVQQEVGTLKSVFLRTVFSGL